MHDGLLDKTTTISQNLDRIKEYFIRFYGDEYKELINRRFSQMKVIGYSTPESLRERLNYILDKKSLLLQQEFFRNIGIEPSKENFEKYFSKTLRHQSSLEIGNFYSCLLSENKSNYSSMVIEKFLKSITNNKNLDVHSDEAKKIIEQLMQYKPFYDQMIEEYKNEELKYKEYFDYFVYCEAIKSKISKEGQQQFLIEIKDYLSKQDRYYIEQCIASKEIIDLEKISSKKLIIAYNYRFEAPIDSFSEENERKLRDSNVSEYTKRLIIQNRISYFKELGVDYGDDYLKYVNAVPNLIPSMQTATEIEKRRKKVYEEEMIKYIEATPEYKKNRQLIDSLNLVNKDDSFTPQNMEKQLIGVVPNLIRTNGQLESFNLILFGDSTAPFADANLIHELNHQVEFNLISADETSYRIVTGWDYINYDIISDFDYHNPEVPSKNERPFKHLTELINELQSQKITNMMHKDNFYVLNDSDNARVEHGTSYEESKFIALNFYETFEKEIIKSRILGNIQIIFDAVGEQNFLEMNNLIAEFTNYFTKMKLYRAINTIKNGEENEDTIKLKYFQTASERIFNNMLEYNQKNNCDSKNIL